MGSTVRPYPSVQIGIFANPNSNQLLRVSNPSIPYFLTTNECSPQIFANLHLGQNTTSLLATGIAGIFEFVFTIPAVLWVDNVGRRTILIAGGIGMAVCHFIVAGIIGSYSGNFENNPGAGWAAVVFVWIFIINFAYSWGEFFFLFCGWVGVMAC